MKTAVAASAFAPIVVDLVVGCTPAAAFRCFTDDIARWWPLASHSVGGADARGVRFEPRVGGRLVESIADGRECTWGTVEAWQPGQRVRFTWHPGRDAATAQWVDVTFAPHPSGTRVTLTHGGWERYGERAAEARTNYVSGWAVVIGEQYARFCPPVAA